MGASASSVWYNLRVPHPTKEVPILDYDLALLFQPMLMLGITVGVTLSVVFPYWLITVLIIILFIGLCNQFLGHTIEQCFVSFKKNKKVKIGILFLCRDFFEVFLQRNRDVEGRDYSQGQNLMLSYQHSFKPSNQVFAFWEKGAH